MNRTKRKMKEENKEIIKLDYIKIVELEINVINFHNESL